MLHSRTFNRPIAIGLSTFDIFPRNVVVSSPLTKRYKNQKREFCVSRKYLQQRFSGMASPVKLETIDTWEQYYAPQKERLIKQFEATYNKHPQEMSPDEISIRPDLNAKISLWRGDITKLQIDAIANAANSSLRGGGGVDGAIHKTAGSKLKEECETLGGCDVGQAKITKGYLLPAKHVIHTVGPRGQKPDLLESCYKNCLQLLLENQLRSVAFPCISTGIYGYPQEPAAHVALHTVRKFLEKNSVSVDRIIFCLFLYEDVKIYENLIQIYFPVKSN